MLCEGRVLAWIHQQLPATMLALWRVRFMVRYPNVWGIHLIEVGVLPRSALRATAVRPRRFEVVMANSKNG